MSQVKSYCDNCHRITSQTVPGYTCEECGKSSSPGGGEAAIRRLGELDYRSASCYLSSQPFWAVNSLMLLPVIITRPWGLAGSLLLMRWLWQRDKLAAEPFWLR